MDIKASMFQRLASKSTFSDINISKAFDSTSVEQATLLFVSDNDALAKSLLIEYTTGSKDFNVKTEFSQCTKTVTVNGKRCQLVLHHAAMVQHQQQRQELTGSSGSPPPPSARISSASVPASASSLSLMWSSGTGVAASTYSTLWGSQAATVSGVVGSGDNVAVVLLLSLLDRNAFSLLESRIQAIRDACPSRCKLAIILCDVELALQWKTGISSSGIGTVIANTTVPEAPLSDETSSLSGEGEDALAAAMAAVASAASTATALLSVRSSALKRASVLDIDAGILEKRGPVSWSELLQILETMEEHTVNLVRVAPRDGGEGLKSLFEDVLYCAIHNRRQSWKKTLPDAPQKLQRIVVEKIEPFIKQSKRKSTPLPEEFYSTLDCAIHDALALDSTLADFLQLYLFTNLLEDAKAFHYLMTHFMDVKDWSSYLNPTYKLIMSESPLEPLLDYPPSDTPIPSPDGPIYTLAFLALQEVPKQVVTLSQLTQLNLSHNKLVSIPTEIGELRALSTLDLSWNRISELPSSICSLQNLTELNVEYNKLTVLPENIGDCIQMNINCSHNQLQSLPHTLAHHVAFGKVLYGSNPFEQLPQQYHDCSQTILSSYLEELGMSSTTRWNKIKLVVVGRENVGKTTLLQRFQGKQHDGISTDGICISDLNIKDVSFSAWDFGGQAVFLPTHQFFLTGRALYLVVFDLEKPDTRRIEYWLRQIAKTVKCPPTPPVILVGTHADALGMERSTELCASLHKQLRCVSGGAMACVPVCAKDGTNFPALEEQIIKAAVTKHMILREKIPGTWLRLDKHITTHKKGLQTITWSVFREWGAQIGISDEQKLKQAALFLHSVGSLIYYESTYSNLGDLVVLDPAYLASLMSTIVTFKTTMISNGYLSKEGLHQIWRQYPASDHDALVNLLSLFLIIHPISHNGKEGYLVPCALPDKEPPDAEEIWPPNIPDGYTEYERTLMFTCLPIGLFGRLLVRVLHMRNITRNIFWTDKLRIQMAAQFDARLQQCAVDFDQTAGNSTSLSIRVRAPDDAKPDLLCQILECVDTTIDCFYKPYALDIQKFVTCNHCRPQTSPEVPVPYRFPLADVISAISRNSTLTCKVENVPIRLNFLVPDLMLHTIVQIDRNDVTDLQHIATGGFGKVYKANMKGAVVAVKELTVKDDEEGAEKFAEFKQEVSLMSTLDNPWIVKFFGVCLAPPMMVMEFVEKGDLFKLLHKPNDGEAIELPASPDSNILDTYIPKENGFKFPMTWRFKLQLCLDVVITLPEGIQINIIFWDLRSPNVFIQTLDPNAIARAKVADFGLSVRAAGKIAGNLATWQWLAPEVLDAQSEEYDEQSDIFSLGVVLYEIATRLFPYDEYAEMPQYSLKRGETWEWKELAMKGAIAKEGLRPTLPSYILPELAELIQKCWLRLPKERPTASKVVEKLENLLGIEKKPEEIAVTAYEQELLPLEDLKPFWEVELGEAKPWSIATDREKCWVGCGDGFVREIGILDGSTFLTPTSESTAESSVCTTSSSESATPSSSQSEVPSRSVALFEDKRKSRIHSLLAIKPRGSAETELWASSECGKIVIINSTNMTKTQEIAAHGEKQIISSMIVVTTSTIPTTQASPAHSTTTRCSSPISPVPLTLSEESPSPPEQPTSIIPQHTSTLASEQTPKQEPDASPTTLDPTPQMSSEISNLDLSSSERYQMVWSASATEGSLVMIDPATKEVVNHVTLEPDVKMNSIVQCGQYVWVGCWRKILILNAQTMATERVLSRQMGGKYTCATVVGNRIWFGVNTKIMIFDPVLMNCSESVFGHEGEVSAICEFKKYGWSADTQGTILAWHPKTLITIKKLVHPGSYLNNIFPVASYLWYTAIHPKIMVGSYAIQKAVFTDETIAKALSTNKCPGIIVTDPSGTASATATTTTTTSTTASSGRLLSISSALHGSCTPSVSKSLRNAALKARERSRSFSTEEVRTTIKGMIDEISGSTSGSAGSGNGSSTNSGSSDTGRQSPVLSVGGGRGKLALSPDAEVPLPTPHHFVLHSFGRFTYCKFCSSFIWGLSKQGYKCTECKYPCHKGCLDACKGFICPGKPNDGSGKKPLKKS